MAILKIWQRHILKDFFKVFFLFISSFYLLYVLIDYSSHTKQFNQSGMSIVSIALYYMCHFTKRAEVLIPFATMLATIKVLCGLNLNRELVGYQAGGFSLKKILTPFVIIGISLTAIIILNFEYLTPIALNTIEHIEEVHFGGSENHKKQAVYYLTLDDNTTLLYQHYDYSSQRFFDVFWLKSLDDIYHMKYLQPYGESPKGYYVDHFTTDENGFLAKEKSEPIHTFERLHFEEKELKSIITPYNFQPPTQLWRQSFHTSPERSNRILAALYLKLASALACILAIIGPAPFCISFSRNMRTFVIYSLSIFSMVTFFTILDAGYILGENGVIPPFIAILIPSSLLLFGLSWRYYKTV